MVTQSLNSLLVTETTFMWNEGADVAFKKSKELMTSYPVLICPNFAKKFTLCTNASVNGLGAVLKQEGQVVA